MGIRITPQFVQEWNRIRDKVDGIRFAEGMGGRNDPDALVIGPHLGGDNNPPARPADETYAVSVTDVVTSKSGVYKATVLTGVATDVNGTHATPKGLTANGTPVHLYNLYEMGLAGNVHLLDQNLVYEGKMIGWESDGTPIVGVFAPPLGVTFAVVVTQDGGIAGTNSPPAAASYTYTVKTLTGLQIGTTIALAFARQLGHVTAATHGIAYYDQSGTLKLAVVDEVIDTSTC